MKEIPGFPGYFVSEDGDICSSKKGYWKKLNPFLGAYGYLCVNLMAPGSVHTRMPIHRAVLTAFRGPYPGKGFEARHLDGNKQNNHLCNLVWGTRRENADDRIRHGSCLSKYRLKDEVVRAIRAEYASGRYAQAELAARYGISQSCVSSYINQKLSNNGERNGNAKLTLANILHIRLFHYFGIENKAALSSEFRVSITCINKIVKNQRWVYP